MSRKHGPVPFINTHVSWSTILNVLILAVALYVFLPQLARFNTSLDTIFDADVRLVAAAAALTVGTYFFAAGIYQLLVIRRKLKYRRTLSVQLASSFTSRLLPAGLGSIGLYIRYLMKSKHSAAQSSSAAAANNLLGFAGHMVLLISALVIAHQPVDRAFDIRLPSWLWWLTPSLLVAAILVMAFLSGLRKKTLKIIADAAKQLVNYRHEPTRLLLGLLCAMAVTFLYATCFFMCMRAVGLELPPAQTFLVFSLGVVTGSVTPTPGGLVGVEAGLLAGLTGFGLAEAASLSAVLLYRLLTYWLPILPGFVMFKILQWRQII